MSNIKKFFNTRFFKSFIWLIVLIFVIDLVSKWAVQLNLAKGDIVTLIPNFLNVTLSYNLGAAFGMGSEGDISWRIFWIIVSIVMSGVLILIYIKKFKTLSTLVKVAICLMIAGAIGNLIDRAFYWNAIVGFDGVIDWIDFYIKDSHFATFNIADASLVIGTILIIIHMVIELVQETIQKNKNGEYSLTPQQLEEKKLKEEESKLKDEK